MESMYRAGLFIMWIWRGETDGSLEYSPIKGPEGNIEYLMYIGKKGEDIQPDAEAIVEASHILDRW